MADVLILIPARLAATRLPGKPLADIAGEPMIVHVLRRAQAADIGPVVVATDSAEVAAAVDKAGGRAVMTAAGSRLRLRPHLRGARQGRFGAARRNRRQCAGRLADHRARRHPRGAPAARRRCRRYRDLGGRDQSARRAGQSPCRQSGGHAGRAEPVARPLFHPRHRAIRRGPALSSHRPLRVSPRGAGTLRQAAAVAARSVAKSSNNCGRWKPACASTSRSSTPCRSASIRPRIWKRRAPC